MYLSLNNRVKDFAELGKILQSENGQKTLEKEVLHQYQLNPWFIPPFIWNALEAIGKMLNERDLQRLYAFYSNKKELIFEQNCNVAVISAGNIPLAGFHDFFSVLFSGNRYVGKLSSQDHILLPALANILIGIAPEYKNKITFAEKLSSFDKIIATGSNNSARYFDYYFGKYPHILRRNRNSIAVLSGNETDEELALLCQDIFLYFGLGCRSISKIFIPENYNFRPLIEAIGKNGSIIADHHVYLNNLDYQKTIHLMNQQPFLDAGCVMLMESEFFSSPISILFYQYYHSLEEINNLIESSKEEIQCVVSNLKGVRNSVNLGKAQIPSLFDYADGMDTIEFLCTKL
ncbi:MAG: hypothetical protein RR356_05350 [Bacteroidales bacterium]